MREITFDIETANILPSLARQDVTRLELAVVAIHDSETGEFSSYSKEELTKLWPIIEKADTLIGYNSNSFDIPLLNHYYPGDLTQIHSVDLMVEVQQVLGRRLRLQSIAEATLKVGKSGDGLQSVRWWQEGLYDKVREYCIQDVRITRQLYDYALEKGVLKYKDLKDIRDVKLSTSSWQQPKAAPAFTHTLEL
ncbi:ribonuclease H-like domain-containing protein [Patescibacteria group bacterium]|nr:ribonuclease H-like domain-containing protein [Patescibacteria group bacterium]MBU2159163.1 ribonuclease H-like domain-containing protein [Patescibacteria group bacterium]MBU2220439.1 ribonuclease H-like domain-containing protein [Patescibacteria group bacterium]